MTKTSFTRCIIIERKINNMDKQNEIVIYQSQDGTIKADTKFEDETVWLTQTQLVELY